ncbi:MAG: hypothetical protein R2769_11870 [Saprospiraceae bacterium]
MTSHNQSLKLYSNILPANRLVLYYQFILTYFKYEKIASALISVYYKDGLEPIIKALDKNGVKIYSTGGTQKFIEDLGVAVEAVENLTSYPSILDGRVKTLHPKVFGGILARREEAHLGQLGKIQHP